MSNVSVKSDELKTLQKEAAELQESRKRTSSVEVKGSEAAAALDDENYDVAGQLETYLNELEEVALERPALALLATFSLGVIVGHLLTRK